MEERKDEVEVSLSCLSLNIENQVRRCIKTSRAASLLDDEEDEFQAQEAEPEPDLISSDDDATISSRSSKSHHDFQTERKNYDYRGQTIDALVLGLTEDVSNFLCTNSMGSIDNADSTNVQPQGFKLKPVTHTRNISDTESLQKMISSGHCGSTNLFGSKGSFVSTTDTQPVAPAKISQKTSCTDMDFQDIRSQVASDVCRVLGSTSPTTTDWISTIGVWSASSRCCVAPLTTINKRSIRNRCSIRRGQSSRMQQIWYQWHSQVREEADEAPRRAADFSRNYTSTTSPTHYRTFGITKSMDDSKLWTKASFEEPPVADLYYDSDPEVFRHAREATIWPSYELPASIDTVASYGSAGATPRPMAPRNARAKVTPSFKGFSYSMSEDIDNTPDLCDDQAVKTFLKELTLGTVTLILHPSNLDDAENGVNNQEPVMSRSPVSVKGWFEMGSRLQSKVVHPKFMWRETYQPELNNHRKLGMSCRTPQSIDLLSMVRILKPDTLDRERYPFAKINCSFSIFSSASVRHVFEAPSPEDRDWFVHGLKLVVARLASMVIVGDDHMFVEYFSPWSHSALLDSEWDEKNASSESFVEMESVDGNRPLFSSTAENDKHTLWGTN